MSASKKDPAMSNIVCSSCGSGLENDLWESTGKAECPFCGDSLIVEKIRCNGCGTSIDGLFQPKALALIADEYQRFVTVFLKHRGKLRAVEEELGVSYPTINKLLEGVNKVLSHLCEGQRPLSRKEILDAIDKGEISAKDASLMLRSRDEGEDK